MLTQHLGRLRRSVLHDAARLLSNEEDIFINFSEFASIITHPGINHKERLQNRKSSPHHWALLCRRLSVGLHELRRPRARCASSEAEGPSVSSDDAWPPGCPQKRPSPQGRRCSSDVGLEKRPAGCCVVEPCCCCCFCCCPRRAMQPTPTTSKAASELPGTSIARVTLANGGRHSLSLSHTRATQLQRRALARVTTIGISSVLL